MEKEKFFLNTSTPPPLTCASLSLPPPNWEASSGMEPQLAELNCGSEQFLNLNWVNFVNQSSPFEQAVSSTVASTRTMPPTVAGSGGASYIGVNLPLVGNSMVPHHPNLAPFTADPGFAERAAKFSCFGNENCGGPMRQFPFPEIELAQGPLLGIKQHTLLRVSSSQSLNTGSNIALQDGLAGEIRTATASSLASERGKNCGLSRSSTPDDAEFGNARCETSVTDLSSKGPSEANAKKRKAVPRVKAKEPSSPPGKDAKEAEDNDLNTKRCKTTEVDETGKDVVKGKTEQNGSPNSGSGGKNQAKDSSNPSEPPKQDYIHVRARRGQATDSHSLAERVRREKISERMKFLQDLVPGCNKVTGKAVMLDEIINYVQSLQRQVEFLSMKLATVNPRLDINVETLLSKDILQSHGSLPQSVYPLDSSASVFSYGNEPQQGSMPTVVSNGLETVNPLDGTLHQTLGMQLPSIDGHRDAASQIANFWEDGLQNVLHMGFGQNAEISFPSQTFQGSLPTTANMKIEL